MTDISKLSAKVVALPSKELPEELERYFSIRELMAWSNESESAWRKRIQRGELRVTHFGSNIRVAKSALDEWTNKNTFNGNNGAGAHE